jgi:hypothetical protein
MKNTNTTKEANAIVDSIQGWIKSFLRKGNKTQVELWAALDAAGRTVRSRRTKKLLQVLLDIMEEEFGGGFGQPQSENAEFDILDAEFLFDEEIKSSDDVEFENVKGYQINDDSLIGDGILKGDFLECKNDFQLSEITPKDICIVRIIPAGGQFCKHVQFNKNGTATLKASNSTFEDVIYRKEEIKILGIAVRAITIKNLSA